ncbi:purine-binding chemotaxis protein CheW [Lentibacillus halodurans]|uniref:Purine-binding chemotaxis protein CheW n=1 Tax=Lentibacillus halodurans TaxID=237679 RepID=A0A1I0VLI1_9BACI|nr:chemotaxis protein CheW [Lentibacillus halodurans]SFA77265.1 purine-binding chemotaxis protein CheW [Lentibacillus halodurans]
MSDETVANRKVIVFQLNNEDYAVSVQQVRSIERIQLITRVPQTSDFIKGVINLRGVVTPVIDLRTRFGMEKIDFTPSSRIIIVFWGDMEVGLIADAANDVMDIPESAIEPAPETAGAASADYIEGVAKTDDRLLILLHLKRVLSADEIKELELTGDSGHDRT